MSIQRNDFHGLTPLQIGDLTAPLPVVQGGMGVGVSLSGLSSAVAQEGGIGVISAIGIGMNDPDFRKHPMQSYLEGLRYEIKRARSMTDGILGVNIMAALTDHERYACVAAEEGIDVIFSGAGLPLNLPDALPEGSTTKLVPIVSSERAAQILCRRWKKNFDRIPDGFVVEGPLAGGHLGFSLEQIADPAYRLETLVAQTVEAVRPFEDQAGRAIPVIAAGGVYTGADMRRFLDLGASAVQMGTRFVTTEECDVAPAFKEAYLACKEEDLILIQSPVGLPGRAIDNEFLRAMRRGEQMPLSCDFQCIISCPTFDAPYCIANALINAQKGNLAEGFAFAGANAYRATEIISVRETIDALLAEYDASGDAQ